MKRNPLSRRNFVKASSATVIGATLGSLAPRAHAAGSDTIRVGLVGCGGRGSGAAMNAIKSAPGVQISALADVFPKKVKATRKRLEKAGPAEAITVTDATCFSGINAYKELIRHPDVDVVILATPPGFRPVHLAEVVEVGKHAFIEKPACVDAVGYRSLLKSDEIARQKGISVVTGTMFRRSNNYMDGVQAMHDGKIGDILFAQARYCSGGIWYRPRKEGMTDVEYQINNWYHFVWLCGDQIVEQAVHNIDAINWAMGGPPTKAYGSGGQRNRPADSEIYDSTSLDFEYPNGATLSFMCRQHAGRNDVSNRFVGTKGTAVIMPFGNTILKIHDGSLITRSKYKGDAYTQEHTDLINSIRSGKPIVEIKELADSSLTAVMGRMAAYTGQAVTWDFMTQESQLDLVPAGLTRETQMVSQGVAVPGRTKLV